MATPRATLPQLAQQAAVQIGFPVRRWWRERTEPAVLRVEVERRLVGAPPAIAVLTVAIPPTRATRRAQEHATRVERASLEDTTGNCSGYGTRAVPFRDKSRSQVMPQRITSVRNVISWAPCPPAATSDGTSRSPVRRCTP